MFIIITRRGRRVFCVLFESEEATAKGVFDCILSLLELGVELDLQLELDLELQPVL